jgi:hypothetical protein
MIRRLYEDNRLPPPERVGLYRMIKTADLPRVRRALIATGYLNDSREAANDATDA